MEAIEALLPVLAMEEYELRKVEGVKYSHWAFLTMFDAKVCVRCAHQKGDWYEIVDPRDLELMFPYGYFIDEFTYAPMLHPNDRCRVERVRDYDEDNKLIERRKQRLNR